MSKAKRLEIPACLHGDNPYLTTELNFNSPFELPIVVLLSAQTTDVSVNKATAKPYPVVDTPTAVLELGVEGMKTYIKTTGFHNNKVENIIRACRILLEQHNGEVPEDRTTLEVLPGIGRKTASVILGTVSGWPIIAVNTYTFRIHSHTQFAPRRNVGQIEEKLLKMTPAGFKVDRHHWLILHGRYTCIARKPRCGSCITEDFCECKGEVDA